MRAITITESPPFKAQWRAFNVGSTACAARVLWQPMLLMAIGDGSSKCYVQGSQELRCVLGIRELWHHPQVSWRNYGGNEEFGSLINHIESKRCKEFWWALSTSCTCSKMLWMNFVAFWKVFGVETNSFRVSGKIGTYCIMSREMFVFKVWFLGDLEWKKHRVYTLEDPGNVHTYIYLIYWYTLLWW